MLGGEGRVQYPLYHRRALLTGSSPCEHCAWAFCGVRVPHCKVALLQRCDTGAAQEDVPPTGTKSTGCGEKSQSLVGGTALKDLLQSSPWASSTPQMFSRG